MTNLENIKSVLIRKPIPPGQITLCKALCEAGSEGLSKSELAGQIRWSDEGSLSGVLGALGNRINQTRGFKTKKPGILLFFEIEMIDGEWHYRMFPEIAKLITSIPDLREAMSLSADEIHKKYADTWLTIDPLRRDRRAYLLTWNPKRWNWNNLPDLVRDVKDGKPTTYGWSCGRRKHIEQGDLAFLLRQGEEPRGIIGYGTVIGSSYEADHWDKTKAAAGKKALYVDVKFSVLLDPGQDAILLRDRLNIPPFSGIYWDPQESGTELPIEIAIELEKLLTNLSETPIIDIKKNEMSFESLQKTEREAVIQSRVGQGKFRSKLIEHWKGCAVTGCKLTEILRASHIKPWRISNNEERLDQYNGLLLIPNLDSAFDNGLISFGNDGQIMISPALEKIDMERLGINPQMKISGLETAHGRYLDYHRRNIFVNLSKGMKI